MYQNNRYYKQRKRKPSRVPEILAAVVGLLLICCAYAGSIDPQSFFPGPFMALAYMPMLIFVLVLLVVALLWRRWLSFLILLVSVLATVPIINMFVPYQSKETTPPMPADPKMMLKVMTYNVLAFNYTEPKIGTKPSESMQLILDADPDVVLLQEGSAGGVDWTEIPSLAPFQSKVRARYPYCYYGTEGLNIMSKYPFTTQAVGEPLKARSPLGYNRNQYSYVARLYDLQMPSGKQLRLIDFRFQSYHLSFGKSMSVRVSPDAKPSSLERMKRSFALRANDAATVRKAVDDSPANVIVCGDMNDITASHVYRVIKGDDLHDAWIDAGSGYGYTYNRHGLRYRIDHVFYRGELLALKADRLTGGSSDHFPIMVTFDLDIKNAK